MYDEKLEELDLESQERMDKAIEKLERDFSTIRTGRATPSVLDRVKVDAYGTECPLNQVATVSVPDARSITVSPFDKSQLGAIERGIIAANIGLNPSNDGTIIRISLPPLTEERRKELCKEAAAMAEDARVSVRQARKHQNDEIKKIEKDEKMPEDVSKQAHDEAQDLTNKYTKKIDDHLEKKEKQIMDI